MDNRPLTPREILEERRIWRWWSRWILKHFPFANLQKICALKTEYMLWLNVVARAKPLYLLNQLLKALNLIPKFCNGLIGVARNDSLPASAALIC